MKKTALAITTAALALGALVSTAPLAHADWNEARGDVREGRQDRDGSGGYRWGFRSGYDRDCDHDDHGRYNRDDGRYGYSGRYDQGYGRYGYGNRYDRDYGRYDYPRYRYEQYPNNYRWYRGWWR